MRLLSLHLYGFKSFANKTEFTFEPGLTAFVGPNGCGKSNIVDAVRWALGEQRPKALRGALMDDVIFKGNGAGRKPLGFAEATVVLSNEDRALPIEYDTVAITRRLYRSGESEYLINNKPCRLRDIRELLMDTGIGMDAYSIVEQGKLDLVLQSNPRDRRAVFEEAAGISKYNAKRRAAQARLERVEQNLLRLGDTIEEVKKRLRYVRRQAAAARRYKEYADSLAHLRLTEALHQYHTLLTERQTTEHKLAECQNQLDGLRASLERLEAEGAAAETDLIECDQRRSALEASLAELHAQHAAAEEAIRLNRERISETDRSEGRIKAELDRLAKRRTEAEQAIAQARGQLDDLTTEIQSLDERVASAREEVKQAAGKAAELARHAEELQTELLDCLRRRAAAQNELAALESECRSMASHKERLLRRRAEIERQQTELGKEEEQARATMAELEDQIASTRARFAARAEERGELRAQIEALNEQIAELSNALSAKKTRRDLLEDLEARFEGVELGTQTLLERQAVGQCLHGMVADLLQVEPQYALAIEAALGGAVQHLVADSLDSAAEAVAHLKAVDGGRTTLLPLDRLSGNGQSALEALEHPGVIAPAISLVSYEKHLEPVVKHLLGSTVVVSDLQAAVEIARSATENIRLATLAGDVLEAKGALSGGSPHERTGLLSRKNELRTLAAELTQLEERLGQLRDRREHFINESAVLDSELEEARLALNHLNLDLATTREQLSRLAEHIANLHKEDLVVASEVEDLDAQLADRKARAEHLAARIQATNAEEEEYKSRVAAIQADQRAADEARTALQRELNDLAVRRAQLASQRAHLEETIRRLSTDLETIAADRQHNQNELAALGGRRQAAQAEIAARENDIRELIQQIEELKTEKNQLENLRAGLQTSIQGIREQAQHLRSQARDREELAHSLQLRMSEHAMRISNLEQQVQERHSADLAKLHEDYQEPDVEWDQLRAEMEQLARKIRNMGTVNLLAIEEQAELEERAAFLESQEQDLLRAKHSLQEVIRKVNRRSRQLFEQTFAAVRGNFQQIFRKLFGGGKADIILEPDADVLEAGIEIIARPPGKDSTKLSLLSGGEKSLTAVAILLAIFKSKPSPFCILDEVDAALDETNIGRFVGLLREFLHDTQFIIITHSKQTMAVANVLYGITMAEPGVSTKVAVRLEDVAPAKVA